VFKQLLIKQELEMSDSKINYMQFGDHPTETLEKLCKKKGWKATISIGKYGAELELDHDLGGPSRFESDDIASVIEFALGELEIDLD